MLRGLLAVVTLLLGPQFLGCASIRTMGPSAVDQEFGEPEATEAVKIVAYTTKDGVRTEYNGVVSITDETCNFTPHSYGTAPFSLPVDKVESFEVVTGTQKGGLAALVLTLSALLVGLFLTMRIHGFE
jgi:hypothetical protein